MKFIVRALFAISFGILTLLGVSRPGHFSLIAPAQAQSLSTIEAQISADISAHNNVTLLQYIYQAVLGDPTDASAIAKYAVTGDPTLAPGIISVAATAVSVNSGSSAAVTVTLAGIAALEALPTGGPGQLTNQQIGAMINQTLVQVEGKTQLNLTPAQMNTLQNDPGLGIVNNQVVSPY